MWMQFGEHGETILLRLPKRHNLINKTKGDMTLKGKDYALCMYEKNHVEWQIQIVVKLFKRRDDVFRTIKL